MSDLPKYKRFQRHRRWWIRFHYKGQDHRWPAGPDEQDAKVLEAKTTLPIQEKRFDHTLASVTGEAAPAPTGAKRVTFKTFTETFLKRHTATLKRPDFYDWTTRILDRHLGEKYLDTITVATVDDFLAERYAEVKASTANRTQTLLKLMLRKAVEWGYLTKNPAEHTKPQRITAERE